MTPPPTYYEILNLPSTLHNEPVIPAQILRSAYRHALLRHHPDKTNNGLKLAAGTAGNYSVDQIAEAFAVLSDLKRRKEYEVNLKLGGKEVRWPCKLENRGEGDGKIGVEVIDLDDLTAEERNGGETFWYKGCRCGDEKGFMVEEEDLESATEVGGREVMVGCRGCSLWLRVLFGVVEE